MLPQVKYGHSINDFNRIVEEDYYDSETYSSTAATAAEMCFRRAVVGGMVLSHFSSKNDVGARRGWQHIRQRSAAFYIIWFPESGKFSVTQDSRSETISREQFVITYGDRPLSIEAAPGTDKTTSQLHVIVPAHLFRDACPEVDGLCGRPFQMSNTPATLARQVFSTLFMRPEQVPAELAARFTNVALEAIGESMRAETGSRVIRRVNMKDAHVQKLLDYIEQHITESDLSVAKVAAGCKISPRYLHYLLKQTNSTFREHVQERRLQQANKWLKDPKYNQFTISEIAYMTGFRSSSHFCHMYRERFGHSPKETRLTVPPPGSDRLKPRPVLTTV
jgi:AraC-like DNA-binding protein